MALFYREQCPQNIRGNRVIKIYPWKLIFISASFDRIWDFSTFGHRGNKVSKWKKKKWFGNADDSLNHIDLCIVPRTFYAHCLLPIVLRGRVFLFLPCWINFLEQLWVSCGNTLFYFYLLTNSTLKFVIWPNCSSWVVLHKGV